jgi:serine/threonine protein kinase
VASTIAPGEVLLGKYQVNRILGEGGMGVVVAATHLQLGEPVAIKFLLPEALRHRDVVQRFLREARAAARLKGEHIARVLDVEQQPDGSPFIVMEFLDGHDLGRLLEERASLPPGDAVDYLLQVCDALAEAHVHGIVHRDIKPANIFLARRPHGVHAVKIVDFGISKVASHIEDVVTRSRATMGTPAYMAPEQMRSARDVDPRADIWAAGVVLFECLAGYRPFDAETFPALCLQVTTNEPAPLPIDVARGLRDIVFRCLEKNPLGRFPDMASLAAALAPYARHPIEAAMIVDRTRAMRTQADSRNAHARVTLPASECTQRERQVTTLRENALRVPHTMSRRSRSAVAAAASAVVIAAAVSMWLHYRDDGPPPVVPAATPPTSGPTGATVRSTPTPTPTPAPALVDQASPPASSSPKPARTRAPHIVKARATRRSADEARPVAQETAPTPADMPQRTTQETSGVVPQPAPAAEEAKVKRAQRNRGEPLSPEDVCGSPQCE